MMGNNHIYFNKNSIIQIEQSFSSCGIKIYTSTEGLYLSVDKLAEELEIGLEDGNLEHELTISDFDKKNFGYISYLGIFQRLARILILNFVRIRKVNCEGLYNKK
jgi:hypothetical protein